MYGNYDVDENGNGVIPDGITKIEAFEFCDCMELKSMIMPNTLQEISNMAFCGCSNLSRIKFSDSLRIIESHAFEGCTALSDIVIPDSVTYIGDKAFLNCDIKNLSHKCLSIRDGLAIKDNTVLYLSCQKTKITIPDGITKIDTGAFRCRGMLAISIPDSVKEIENNLVEKYIFENKTADVPDSVKIIVDVFGKL